MRIRTTSSAVLLLFRSCCFSHMQHRHSILHQPTVQVEADTIACNIVFILIQFQYIFPSQCVPTSCWRNTPVGLASAGRTITDSFTTYPLWKLLSLLVTFGMVVLTSDCNTFD